MRRAKYAPKRLESALFAGEMGGMGNAKVATMASLEVVRWAGAAVVLAAVLVAPTSRVAYAAAPAELEAETCAAGLEALPTGGCFAEAVASVPQARGLLVYLHGMYAPAQLGEELERQGRVAKLATARGYAVLALRGQKGECTTAELSRWWCWPSNERNVQDGEAFVARWAPSFEAVQGRIGAVPRVLLGFSNGAYFAAQIALRGLAPFDAVVVAHGGPTRPVKAVGATPPVLLITADQDPSDGEMRRLDADLTKESYPHAIVSRAGGHSLPNWDIESALSFFEQPKSGS